MKTFCMCIIFALVLLMPLSVASAADADEKNGEQDKRIEALMERVKRLEALVGPDEKPSPVKPTMATRLDRLERKVRGIVHSVKAFADEPRESIQQLSQSLKEMAQQIRELTRRIDRVERKAETDADSNPVRALRRVVDRLQRQLDDVQQRLRNLQ